MIDFQQLKEKFISCFGSESRCFRAPGRINLIGEHTDYNGGFVFPMAIDKEICAAIAPRNDRKIRVYSVNLNQFAEFDLDKNFEFKPGFWSNYVEGVARILEEKGFKLSGADILIWSDVPSGAGLSSSAALEVVCALSLSKISGYDVDGVTLAKIGQQTEHEFVGVKVGIMDQFVSAKATKNHALLLDCRSLEFENVPLDLSETSLIICNSNVKHDLATSEYNTRRAECEQAVEILQRFLPETEQLRDVSLEDLLKYKNEFTDNVFRRALHVITENNRTIEAVKCLKNNDLQTFGKLLYESHTSLKDNYEVSCFELDTLVEISKTCEGVIGARMTGGGFGGSTVNLVKKDNVSDFTEKIMIEYPQRTGIIPTILIAETNNGASEF